MWPFKKKTNIWINYPCNECGYVVRVDGVFIKDGYVGLKLKCGHHTGNSIFKKVNL